MQNTFLIGYDGLGDASPIDPQHIELCKKWITLWTTKQRTINKARWSYSLKHAVQRCFRPEYISNGAFIAAAQELGYRFIPCWSDSPNAYFNMSFSKARKDSNLSRIDE